MSDLLFVGCHPYLGDGSPQRLLEVLNSILDGSAGVQNATCFVPGHGPVGALADLQRLAGYIQDCQQIAETLSVEGKTDQATIDSVPVPPAYAGWIVPRFFYANLRTLLGKG